MSKYIKLLHKLKQSKSEVRFEDIAKLLANHGFHLISSKGSHFKFRNQNGKSYVIPVHKSKVKSIYVKQIINDLEL